MRAKVHALALVACALIVMAPASADGSVTKILSYEAPTLEVRVAGEWSRGPYASGSDPSGTRGDGRVDAGRLFTTVPAGARAVDLTVVDALAPFTPIRFEWFRADGATAGGAGERCAPRYAALPVEVPGGAAFLVIRVHATSIGDTGACRLDAAPAGATTGDVVLTFGT